ncbi:hypothetical protein D9V37_01795 [Nocardioides mangrovicus]|uniref:DUF3592 domain-containing protein n=1 Tax=Nocardioides mangrovicus TaxID=2478913 RepID=A0A3L8P670_9ACTN|nr:hypothetical protein D9V37_01795 [Nocardioides mangrovicus]
MVALFVGQFLSILLLVLSGFVLPYRWRTSSVLGPLLVGLVGADLVVAGLGYRIGGGSAAGGLGIAIAGVLVLAVGASTVWLKRRARARRDDVRAHGAAVAGLITEVSTSESVNNVPRWRIVVRFVDSAGDTRYWVDHRTTYSPPAQGQQVLVHYDPANPGDKRHIVADY